MVGPRARRVEIRFVTDELEGGETVGWIEGGKKRATADASRLRWGEDRVGGDIGDVGDVGGEGDSRDK